MRPRNTTITKVRRWAVRAGHCKPFGVHTELRLLAGGTQGDPEFAVNKAPIYRLAREIWLRAHSNPVPGDALTWEEIRRAVYAIHGHQTGTCRLQQGPLYAVAEAMSEWKWSITTSTVWINEKGSCLDVTVGSPSMLVKYMIASHETMVNQRVQEQLVKRGKGPINLEIMRKYMTSKKVPAWEIPYDAIHKQNTTDRCLASKARLAD